VYPPLQRFKTFDVHQQSSRPFFYVFVVVSIVMQVRRKRSPAAADQNPQR